MTGWTVTLLVQGYPGKALENGGLGWSSVALARGPEGRVAVFDTGGSGLRRTLVQRLRDAGVAPADVTDLLLSHLHYDHCENWPLFRNATIHVRAAELDWALALPEDDLLVPVHVVHALAATGRVAAFDADAAPLPGIAACDTPGHSPHHVSFVLQGGPETVIFAADAAKNLAELVSGDADMTVDAAASRASIARLAAIWAAEPRALFIAGHDLPLRRDADGTIHRVGARRAGIGAVLGTDLAAVTRFALDDA
jgi:glyoxylase-like metal-dependent hydrolase (beta-lactamase superfamily II)